MNRMSVANNSRVRRDQNRVASEGQHRQRHSTKARLVIDRQKSALFVGAYLSFRNILTRSQQTMQGKNPFVGQPASFCEHSTWKPANYARKKKTHVVQLSCLCTEPAKNVFQKPSCRALRCFSQICMHDYLHLPTQEDI